MTVVLNRGGPTQMNGFAANDTVRFGAGMMVNGTFSIPAHSVSVIELNAATQNGSSENETQPTVTGCMDAEATNYQPLATEDDGSCIYPPPPIRGCTDSTAANFNAQATEDDGTCTYPVESVLGCMDMTATNHNPLATEDDGSCTFETNETNSTGNETGNSTNTTSSNGSGKNEETNVSENSTSNETGTYTCEGCCGDSFEVESEAQCPIVDCAPCDDGVATTAGTAVRNTLIGVAIVLVLLLTMTGRRPPETPDDEIVMDHAISEGMSFQENLS